MISGNGRMIEIERPLGLTIETLKVVLPIGMRISGQNLKGQWCNTRIEKCGITSGN
jgi:hypothetical protein